MVQRASGQDVVTPEPVAFVATWDTDGVVPGLAMSAFTTWSANVAEIWVSARVNSVLGGSAASWAQAVRPYAGPEGVAAAMASATAGVLGRWPDYAHHESRGGSILDLWTIDPHFIQVVVDELGGALQAVLPPDVGDETRRAIYDGAIILGMERLAPRVWRLITRKGRRDPSTTIPPPPSSVRTKGEVSVEFPNGDARTWKRQPGRRSRSRHGTRKGTRRRKR